MSILKGTFPALLTPYKDNGEINEAEFIRLCEFGISKGLNGLFCNGSAGDSQAISLDKQIKLMKLSKSASKGQVPIITGISSCVYENTQILADEAYKNGLDALLLSMPYYYKFDEDTIFEYVKSLARSVKLPLFIYNIPLFAPPLSLKLIERLASLENVVGIKDSSGDALLLNHILDLLPSEFEVFIGREEFYAGALIAGANGSMTSIAGIFPELMSGIYESFKRGDLARAKSFQKSLLKAIRFGMSLAFPMGFALLLKARGFEYANYTPHPLSNATKEALNSRFEEAKIIIKELEKEAGIKL